MLKYFTKLYITFILIIFVICILFIPIIYSSNINYSNKYYEELILSNNNFFWPLPGYTYISSYFGRRNSPTAKASSYHSGIDIPASENSKVYAIEDGTITFASWGAGGGYTIVLKLKTFQDMSVSYCHLSPNYIVELNQSVSKGELIAYIGPKNVYGINNNPYTDNAGNPTNGATTGSHLHLTIKKDGTAVNPLDYF